MLGDQTCNSSGQICNYDAGTAYFIPRVLALSVVFLPCKETKTTVLSIVQDVTPICSAIISAMQLATPQPADGTELTVTARRAVRVVCWVTLYVISFVTTKLVGSTRPLCRVYRGQLRFRMLPWSRMEFVNLFATIPSVRGTGWTAAVLRTVPIVNWAPARVTA